MSVFKTKGIILKITKVKDKDFIYDVFTYDYGKIKIQKKDTKKEKTLDIGYIVNFEIETKQGRDINKAKNIKIKSEFKYENKEFKIINEYLNIIGQIYTKIPEGLPFKDIFEIIEAINDKNNLDSLKLILAKLKIIDYFGELKLENDNIIIKKILKFINENKIKEVLKLGGIDEKTQKELKNIF
nr:recombination protein O N-terminal domain-containing protein [Candidatus Gracilibacteria bacterium]